MINYTTRIQSQHHAFVSGIIKCVYPSYFHKGGQPWCERAMKHLRTALVKVLPSNYFKE